MILIDVNPISVAGLTRHALWKQILDDLGTIWELFWSYLGGLLGSGELLELPKVFSERSE